MNALDLKGICGKGGIVEVDAAGFNPLDLKGIALAGKGTGGGLVIRNAQRLSALDAKGIADNNPGNVRFIF